MVWKWYHTLVLLITIAAAFITIHSQRSSAREKKCRLAYGGHRRLTTYTPKRSLAKTKKEKSQEELQMKEKEELAAFCKNLWNNENEEKYAANRVKDVQEALKEENPEFEAKYALDTA